MATHICILQSESKLNPEKPETHVPNLPKGKGWFFETHTLFITKMVQMQDTNFFESVMITLWAIWKVIWVWIYNLVIFSEFP